ncbi:hypothetical protein ACLOJK_024671 [Asimina triloba]
MSKETSESSNNEDTRTEETREKRESSWISRGLELVCLIQEIAGTCDCLILHLWLIPRREGLIVLVSKEGAGHQVASAFVEIVFDNSDNRIPVDKEEVHLRRTVGPKKDEYFLDKKHITKTEVMNLLESAGFSRSNPYYVVQQGKIASLTLMKDSQRLDLLKEIGGTRVYEERRQESLKIMQETGKFINAKPATVQLHRLRELDEEKEELRKYQQLDKQRRSLEYTIYDKELHDAKQKLTDVEDARLKVSEKSKDMYDSVLEAHDKLKSLEKEFKSLTRDIQALNKEKEVMEKQRTDAIKMHAQIELDVKDLQEKISADVRAKDDARRQLQSLKIEIEESRSELNEIIPNYELQVVQEEEITKKIMEREKQLSILYQKQGRATQFSSKGARDRWLQKEIDDLERVQSSNSVQEKKLQDEIQQLDEEFREREEYIEGRKADLQKQESIISKCVEDFNTLKIQRDELQDTRKSLWKKESDLSSEIDRMKAEVVKAEKSLDHATPGDIRRGLNSVRRICRDHNIGGVFGPIFELIDCEDRFFTAVEVTAGNSLFHVVVETDEISTRIIRYLTAEKGGRITFIPLNRVKAPHVTFPHRSDVVPLLKRLKYSPVYAPAFAQVFGRTAVCKDLDVATKVARSDGLDCITLEAGDQEKLLANARVQIEQLKAGIAMKKAEMGTDLIDHLTAQEKDDLSRLNPEITELKEQLIECKTNRIEIETRKGELETNLATNLVRREQELLSIIQSGDSTSSDAELEQKREELKDAKAAVDEATRQLKKVVQNIEGLTKKTREIKNAKDELKAKEDNYQRTLQDEAKEIDQLLNKRTILLQKQEDLMKKIRDLGSLPSDAFDAYKRKNIKELQKMLQKCNDQLKQFSHVNKKALDQYINFTEQREELQKRQAELDAGYEKIKELISVLDQRKDEAIERTFKGVARHFREVFSELVQGGHGFLVMMKKKDVEAGDDYEDEDGPHDADQEGRVEKYIGVKVKVSFTGQGETQSMKQLSGGQKTVVALTLIFAIQRCDPAPFYLFDEIDAALDPQYRTAVGNMIRRLADMANTQFITTTFRPELVKVADKIYGVTHKNRVSHVDVVSKEEALDFIEHDQSHQAE